LIYQLLLLWWWHWWWQCDDGNSIDHSGLLVLSFSYSSATWWDIDGSSWGWRHEIYDGELRWNWSSLCFFLLTFLLCIDLTLFDVSWQQNFKVSTLFGSVYLFLYAMNDPKIEFQCIIDSDSAVHIPTYM
jgi:hypothetical protein